MKRRYFFGLLTRASLALFAACGGKTVFDGAGGHGYGAGSGGYQSSSHGSGYGALDRTRSSVRYGYYEDPADPSAETITLADLERG